MNASHRVRQAVTASVLCLAPGPVAWAAETDEIAELKRAIEALKAENRALSQRLSTLEAQKAAPPAQRAQTDASGAAPRPDPASLEERVKELEGAKAAQETAVRQIIRESVGTLGSKINESVSFGGTLGVTLGRSTDFSGERKSAIGLSSVEFEFEVQVNEWALGHIKFEHLDAKSNPLLQTPSGTQTGVDRFSVDTAFIALGDRQRFPALLSAGRMVLPFGISTGHPVADVLSSNSPLTVEAFETRQNAVMFGLAFPTPPLKPPTPPVVAPPVRPMVIAPLVGSLARQLGYKPLPTRPPPLAPTAFAPEVPAFNAGIYIFEGRTPGGLKKHFGATAGYHAKGHCGRPYHELSGSGLCPWAVNADLAYNSSIFNSRFLESEYESFLTQIGRVPGMSASVKAAMGPFSVVGEWNGATRRAQFRDDAGTARTIQPSAWQVSLGYQFGWNPWVQEIGAQGTYVAIGYSQSRDLAGVMRAVDTSMSRVGFVPRKRLLLTAGEWVADGLRLVVEYSRDWDYSVNEGGTGRTGNGLFTTLTYVW